MQKQEETSMAEQGSAVQTEGKEGNAQRVEARTCDLRKMQECCLDMQRWDQESQCADGTALGEGCKKKKKEFFRYIGQKRWTIEDVPPLINEREELATTDMGKAEVLSEFFASVSTGSQDSHISHIPEPAGGN